MPVELEQWPELRGRSFLLPRRHARDVTRDIGFNFAAKAL